MLALLELSEGSLSLETRGFEPKLIAIMIKNIRKVIETSRLTES